MKEESYSFKKEPGIFYYEFFSEGPKGRIRKVVQFHQITSTDNIYNLGFGDFNEELGDIDDLSVSNNQDTQKVLTTVAQTVIDFMLQHPHATVLAKGSTPSRTRLYQMGISQFWDEIGMMFEIKGFIDNGWQPYERGKNFEAFVIVKSK
ncbi:DUF6934 family protein [Mucilaginibacter gotjawali]|uniref:Uncharacterized protein n=2 Tax=Mucilaginibacter gotjawali TaxID=1550579 RepID=A0A839SE10_9SPHI|nr:hypothetical protein [Mucilaginibacter gotjawali]MBB3055798.1 hypothetical protein [Mucilaginibacter gotjawali]BAU54619.1 hypothetical protein MgSA37_02795 [Mucilaginibacter gotjawali]